MTFTLAPELAGIVRPGVLRLHGAVVVGREPSLDAPLAEAEAAMRALHEARAYLLPTFSAQTTGQGHGLRLGPHDLRRNIDLVRTMYKQVGIDPTKRRPSSEALLRRVLKGEPLPRVNSAVDVCNWCSFEFQLPYGLYDAVRISGDVALRIGAAGESYPGIRKDDVHVGGRITLADAEGPFGNPTSDSARTMVTASTTNILLVVFAPHELPMDQMSRVLSVTSDRMRRHTSASLEKD